MVSTRGLGEKVITGVKYYFEYWVGTDESTWTKKLPKSGSTRRQYMWGSELHRRTHRTAWGGGVRVPRDFTDGVRCMPFALEGPQFPRLVESTYG